MRTELCHRCPLSPALHQLPGAHTCPFTVGAVPCPDHGFPCPGSPGRLREGRERYELDALSWQGHRLGLDELQKPGETPQVVGVSHSTRAGEHPRDLTEAPGALDVPGLWGARMGGECQWGDPEHPGLRWEELRDNGAVGTRHSRVGGDGGDPGRHGVAGDMSPVLPGAMRMA